MTTIDPLTYALELINFLVLLWLLRRFLYAPVKQAIAERRQTLNQNLETAQLREQEAASKQAAYQHNLEEWEAEKTRQQEELQHSLAQERERLLAKVRQESEAEQVRLQTLSQQELETARRQARETAAASALELTSRMLTRLAGASLDQALLEVLLEDVQDLPETDTMALRAAALQVQGELVLTSARPMQERQVEEVQTALARLLEQAVHCRLAIDGQLISGVRLTIGDRVLHANLGDELAFFRGRLSLEHR